MLIRAHTIRDVLCLGWLTGPIFDKELRIASRRRSNYVIRAGYVAILAFIMFVIWLTTPFYGPGISAQRGDLALLGREITKLVTWSQFILCQVLAVIMLSTAISNEIYHKTLGVLMTTPISSFQIVAGKLLSKLLQLLLIIGVSLPVLAAVRVFGGIPWSYVLFSVCLTMSVSLLAGSLTLYFSISQRRAYIVIVQTVVTFLVVFALIPLLTILFVDKIMGGNEQKIVRFFMVANPYAIQALATDWLMTPRGWRGRLMAYWPWHCAGLLGCAALLLLLSTLRVRKVALRQIAGSPAAKKPVRKPKKARMRRTCQPWLQLGMGNWPVLWKDLRTPVFGRSRVRRVVTMLLVLGGLGFFYILLAADHALDDDETHAVFCCLLTMLATFFTVIVPATSVTSEKESRSWPLLLGTTQSDWRILSSKWLALLRWCLPPWMLLFGHVLFFTLFGLIHPVALIQLGLVTAGIVNLLIGMGLYWSTRRRRTTTAVVRNFIVPLAIWVLIPLVSIMVAEFSHLSSRTVEGYLRWHPFFQAGAIGEACTGYQGQRLTYDWVTNRLNVWESTGVLFKTMCVHSMIGLGFAWRAKGLFRRNIF